MNLASKMSIHRTAPVLSPLEQTSYPPSWRVPPMLPKLQHLQSPLGPTTFLLLRPILSWRLPSLPLTLPMRALNQSLQHLRRMINQGLLSPQYLRRTTNQGLPSHQPSLHLRWECTLNWGRLSPPPSLHLRWEHTLNWGLPSPPPSLHLRWEHPLN